MAGLVKMLVFQRDDAPLLPVADFVGLQAMVVPMSSIRATVLTTVSFRFLSEFAKARGQGVTGVFLVEHRGHMVGATGVSSSVIDWMQDWHGSRHGHVDWGSNVDS